MLSHTIIYVPDLLTAVCAALKPLHSQPITNSPLPTLFVPHLHFVWHWAQCRCFFALSCVLSLVLSCAARTFRRDLPSALQSEFQYVANVDYFRVQGGVSSDRRKTHIDAFNKSRLAKVQAAHIITVLLIYASASISALFTPSDKISSLTSELQSYRLCMMKCNLRSYLLQGRSLPKCVHTSAKVHTRIHAQIHICLN